VAGDEDDLDALLARRSSLTQLYATLNEDADAKPPAELDQKILREAHLASAEPATDAILGAGTHSQTGAETRAHTCGGQITSHNASWLASFTDMFAKLTRNPGPVSAAAVIMLCATLVVFVQREQPPPFESPAQERSYGAPATRLGGDTVPRYQEAEEHRTAHDRAPHKGSQPAPAPSLTAEPNDVKDEHNETTPLGSPSVARRNRPSNQLRAAPQAPTPRRVVVPQLRTLQRAYITSGRAKTSTLPPPSDISARLEPASNHSLGFRRVLRQQQDNTNTMSNEAQLDSVALSAPGAPKRQGAIGALTQGIRADANDTPNESSTKPSSKKTVEQTGEIAKEGGYPALRKRLLEWETKIRRASPTTAIRGVTSEHPISDKEVFPAAHGVKQATAAEKALQRAISRDTDKARIPDTRELDQSVSPSKTDAQMAPKRANTAADDARGVGPPPTPLEIHHIWETIRTLNSERRNGEARRLLASLRRAFPNLVVPPDIYDLIEPPPAPDADGQ
jgi:hypothetical protein